MLTLASKRRSAGVIVLVGDFTLEHLIDCGLAAHADQYCPWTKAVRYGTYTEYKAYDVNRLRQAWCTE